jgi:phosphoglycolate phosphatase
METISIHAQQCPLCESTRFKDFRNRKRVQCAQCGSLPRTRAAWLVLRDYARLQPNARIAHFAPEPVLARRLYELCGAGYEAYDFEPERYQERLPFTQVRQCDLCTDTVKFDRGSYDAIIHNHVLEHLPCEYSIVLLRLQALLKPGGVHVFSVPILRGYTKSNLAPTLSAQARVKEFGHPEHVRYFGTLDHDQNLGMVFGQTLDKYRLEDYVDSGALLKSNVSRACWRATGEGVFVVRQA